MSSSKPTFPVLSRLGPSGLIWIAAATGVAVGLLAATASTPIVLLALGVGVIGTAAILAMPELGLLAIVVTTYLSLSNILIQFYGAPSLAKILAPLVLAAILLRWARTGERPEGWRKPALLASAYGIACVLSLLAAHDPGRAIGDLQTLAKNVLVFLIVAVLVKHASTLRRVVWTLIAVAALLGTIAVHQQLTGNFDFNYWGFGQAPEVFALKGETTRRLGGPIGDPNFFGLMMLALVPLALDRAIAEKGWATRLLAMWAALVTSMTVVFTYSRSALVSFVALLLIFVVVRRPRPAQLLAAALVALLLLPLVPSSYAKRIAGLASSVVEITEQGTTREVSVRGRLSENLVAFELFLDYPVFGAGLGNYPILYYEYSRRIGLDPRSTQRQPHNLYLEVLSETGLVGMTAFGLLLWVALGGAYRARRALRQAGRTDVADLVEGVALGFVGYLIASLFLHAFYPRYFWLVAGIVIALPRVAAAELADVETG